MSILGHPQEAAVQEEEQRQDIRLVLGIPRQQVQAKVITVGPLAAAAPIMVLAVVVVLAQWGVMGLTLLVETEEMGRLHHYRDHQ